MLLDLKCVRIMSKSECCSNGCKERDWIESRTEYVFQCFVEVRMSCQWKRCKIHTCSHLFWIKSQKRQQMILMNKSEVMKWIRHTSKHDGFKWVNEDNFENNCTDLISSWCEKEESQCLSYEVRNDKNVDICRLLHCICEAVKHSRVNWFVHRADWCLLHYPLQSQSSNYANM